MSSAVNSGIYEEFFEASVKRCFPKNLELQEDDNGNVAVGLQNKWLCNLVILKLHNCTLPYAIPSAILPLLNNLEELEVQDSDEVEVIFYMNDIQIMETPQLKKLTFRKLSELTRVWGKNSEGVVIFRNLQEVIVSDCEKLQTLFPASLAKNLMELEKIEIKSCLNLRAIVEREDTTANVEQKFVFPRLEKLDLFALGRVTHFYPQTFTLECPTLNKLSVLGCHRLELFQSTHPKREGVGTSIYGQPLISNLKVISNLKELRLDRIHISALGLWFRSVQFKNGLKELKHIDIWLHGPDEDPMLSIEIFRKTPNLTQMDIKYCNYPEIFFAKNLKIGEDGMLGQLKILTLFNVSALHSIESKDSSWLNIICDKLHFLSVDQCPDLTTLVHSPSTISFSYLKEVFISRCVELQYLFTSSTVKKLMNLEKITVKECESMKEIVAKEGDATSDTIKFERLNTIVLHSLPSLICFYSGSDTLQLSSLMTLYIRECPDMRIFSQGVTNAESFRGIRISKNPNKNLLFHQNLNASVEAMFQLENSNEAVEEGFSDYLLRAGLHDKVDQYQKWLWSSLKTLKLDNLTEPCAIPSNVLPHVKNLEELEVQDCDDVEVIFDMNDTQIMETPSRLKKLTLKELPKLRRVWEIKNGKGVLVFQNLQDVVVSRCENLQALFPASLAKNLKKLGRLEIENCRKLQEIVEEEEGTTTNIIEKFVFTHLEELVLYDLPQVTCFYPQTFTLECPSLNKLCVCKCHKLELFQSAYPIPEGESRVLISNLKVISKLKNLNLDWKHISALCSRLKSEQFAEGLKYLNDISLLFEADENEKPVLPIEILQKAPALTRLGIVDCKSPRMFLAENPKIEEARMLGQLKLLSIHNVSMLLSIESEDSSWLNTVCEKLHELRVSECPDLMTLVHSPSTVSFFCLKKLSMYGCPDLQYLFSSSAAKKLMNLKEIIVKSCYSVKEIVAGGSDEDEDEHKGEGEEDKSENELIFWKLEILTLDSLPKFESFYMGSYTLNFPSLKEVAFVECYNTKLFRLGDKVPAKLKVTKDGVNCEEHINSVILQKL